MSDSVPGQSPSALAAPVFPFRSLALLAGRAPLGGPREIALATFVAARLAASTAVPAPLDGAVRARRAEAARQWIGSVALPPGVRAAFLRLAACTGEENVPATHAAMAKVMELTAATLDRSARAELDRLLARLAP